MQIFNYKNSSTKKVLALGAESAGNFSFFINNKLYFSENFGDLLVEDNFIKFKKSVLNFIKNNNFKPNIILTDLHPLYKNTLLGKTLAKKYSAQHMQIQHHHAHVFSAVGDNFIQNSFYGIAMDGTGYGLDEKIWGGEVFKITNSCNCHSRDIQRIGHLENQIMIGGDLAIREPARMLIGILEKFLTKKEVYTKVKKYYSAEKFEVLYNQLQQNFNCIETSSTGRALDTVSLLLGFCRNERKYKHEPIDLLEKNSSKPYTDLKPEIIKIKNTNSISENPKLILRTTPLFEYLIKNINKDKKRLAATAQSYIAEGLHEIIKLQINARRENQKPKIFIAGGIANNKIISQYFETKNVYNNKKIPRGDAGISFGQIIYYLFNLKC